MEYMLGFWELKLADDFAKTHAACTALRLTQDSLLDVKPTDEPVNPALHR
jgi:hypothetical protein